MSKLQTLQKKHIISSDFDIAAYELQNQMCKQSLQNEFYKLECAITFYKNVLAVYNNSNKQGIEQFGISPMDNQLLIANTNGKQVTYSNQILGISQTTRKIIGKIKAFTVKIFDYISRMAVVRIKMVQKVCADLMGQITALGADKVKEIVQDNDFKEKCKSVTTVMWVNNMKNFLAVYQGAENIPAQIKQLTANSSSEEQSKKGVVTSIPRYEEYQKNRVEFINNTKNTEKKDNASQTNDMMLKSLVDGGWANPNILKSILQRVQQCEKKFVEYKKVQSELNSLINSLEHDYKDESEKTVNQTKIEKLKAFMKDILSQLINDLMVACGVVGKNCKNILDELKSKTKKNEADAADTGKV